MLISEEVKYFQGVNTLAFRENDNVPCKRIDESPEGSIPPRYRDGLGGINLEQVKQDQRQARRELILAMARRLGTLWHR